MTQVPIFLINLPEATERFRIVAARLAVLGLAFERVEAVQGRTMSEASKRAVCPQRFVWWHRRDLTDGEIGCYASHLAVWRLIAARGIARACILEDDVVLAQDFPAWVQSSTPLPADCDVLKLEGICGRSERRGIPLLRHAGRQIAFIPKPAHGSAAYVMTQSGAQRALSALAVMKDHLDQALFEYWWSGLFVTEVCPYPARQQGTSDIAAERDNAWSRRSPGKSLPHRLRRRWREAGIFLRQWARMLQWLRLKAFVRQRLPVHATESTPARLTS